MSSVEVAFERPEEIAVKLSHYEQLFKHRYTELDKDYQQCINNAEKMLQVPVIDPWPPRGIHSRRGGGRGGRYDDWEGGGRRRGYRGRRRDYRSNPYTYNRYYDDRSQTGSWSYGRRSPRDDFRDRSPHRHHSHHSHQHHRRGSTSPLPYPSQHSPPPPSSSSQLPPPPPTSHHHYYHQAHMSPPPTSHPSSSSQQQHLSPRPPHYHHRSRSRSISPDPRNKTSPPSKKEDDNQEAPPTTKPHPLDLDLDESNVKTSVPSETDVLDILSSAHATLHSQVTAENLRKAKMEGKKIHRSKPDNDSIKTSRKLSSSTGHHIVKNQDEVMRQSVRQGDGEERGGEGGGLVVTHGKTEVVSTSYLLGSNDEEGKIGREGGIDNHSQKKMKKKKRGVTDGEMASGTTERSRGTRLEGENIESGGPQDDLVMRLDKKFCHSSSLSSMSSVLSHSVPNTPSSDLTPTFDPTSLTNTTATSSSHSSHSTSHRDLKIICSKVPISVSASSSSSSTVALPTIITDSPAPHLSSPHHHTELHPHKEKKRKKKKKKKKMTQSSSSRQDDGDDDDNITSVQGPLKLKISLGKS